MNAAASSVATLLPAALADAAVLIVKVTLVLAAAALLAALLRGRAASTRHDVWALALAATLALALLAPFAPRIGLPVPAAGAAFGPAPPVSPPVRTAAEPAPATPREGMPADRVELTGPRAPAVPRPDAGVPRVGWVLAALWAAGTAALALRCAFGHAGLRRLRRSAQPLDGGAWPALLADARRAAAVPSPVALLRSPEVATPVTWGTRRPVVVLPAEAESWPEERRRAALLHELAHVARRDHLAQLVGTAACACYWFHPAAWMALRRLRREGELACDDRVLASGAPAAEYAAQLLDVARGARALRLRGSALAIGMARPSTLEGRILAVLDGSVPRRPLPSRARLAAAVALSLALVPLSGLTPVARGSLVPATSLRGAAGGEVTASYGVDAAGDGGRHAAGDRRARSRSEEAREVIPVEGSVEAAPGEELTLDLEAGAGVRIQGWDEPRVELRGSLGGVDARDCRAELLREPGGVRLRAWYAGDRQSWSTSHRFELRVPRRFDVTLESTGGDLSVEDVEGSFRGSTAGGSIVLARLRGRADLSTGGGEVRVSDSTLAGSVTTGGGLVTLSRISGGLRGHSGSGPVIYAEPEGGDPDGPTGDLTTIRVGRSGDSIALDTPDVDAGGRLHVSRAGGDVRLAEAPRGAVLETGGGDIVLGSAAGVVEATTGGGSIRIGPVAGSVRAGTGAGRVEVSIADAGGEPQTVEIHSGIGDVVVELPEGFDGVVELETAYTERFGRATRITSAWPLERPRGGEDRWDTSRGTPRRYVRARGTLGAGTGLVRVVTVNGDVELRRGGG
jgi:beta-lactamase regulating signal transducer with metallopeptidase domain